MLDAADQVASVNLRFGSPIGFADYSIAMRQSAVDPSLPPHLQFESRTSNSV
jgi:hypothetical protein